MILGIETPEEQAQKKLPPGFDIGPEDEIRAHVFSLAHHAFRSCASSAEIPCGPG